MVMVGHNKRLSEPLRSTTAGRIGALLVASGILCATVAVLVIGLTSSARLRPGCISVSSASTVGGVLTSACGSRAKEICAHPAENPGLALHHRLQEACRRARLP